MNKKSKTKIIATIGPASGKLKTLQMMIKSGMDMARLNMSFVSYKEHKKYINLIRKAGNLEKKEIPIILDLSGPRIKNKEGHTLDKENKNIITDKDRKDILFGIENNVDFFAMSYVKEGDDINNLKDIISKLNNKIKIIAKIERTEALKNLEKIIQASDAIMIARGDLGNALPYENLPYIQNKIIKKVIKYKKEVIVATEMLFSMKENLRPTRAEVSDIVLAILEKANCLMLSDETAVGKYPIESVQAMEKIILKAEKISKKLKKPLEF